MGYDFGAVQLPELFKKKGTVSATTSQHGTVRICSRNPLEITRKGRPVDGAWRCIEVREKDAIELAKFLSEVYL